MKAKKIPDFTVKPGLGNLKKLSLGRNVSHSNSGTIKVEIIRPVLHVMKKSQGRNFRNLDPPLSI